MCVYIYISIYIGLTRYMYRYALYIYTHVGLIYLGRFVVASHRIGQSIYTYVNIYILYICLHIYIMNTIYIPTASANTFGVSS